MWTRPRGESRSLVDADVQELVDACVRLGHLVLPGAPVRGRIGAEPRRLVAPASGLTLDS